MRLLLGLRHVGIGGVSDLVGPLLGTRAGYGAKGGRHPRSGDRGSEVLRVERERGVVSGSVSHVVSDEVSDVGSGAS